MMAAAVAMPAARAFADVAPPLPTTVMVTPVAPMLPPETKLSIEVVGNLRTRPEVILRAAELSPQQLDAQTLAEVQQRIFNLRLFEAVEVTGRDLETAAPVVTIRVKERWTLFPIPFVTSASRGVRAGVILLESNLFGRNKTVALGGIYSAWGSSGFAIYQDPSIAGTRATLRVIAIYAQSDRERWEQRDIIYRYQDTRTELSLLGGYQLTRQLNLSAGWFGSHIVGEPGMDVPAMTLGDGWLQGWTASLDYRGADFKTYYDAGLAASLTYEQARRALGSDRDLLDLSARVQYTRALLPRQATSLIAQLDLVESDSALDTRLLGGRVGTRGFEQQGLWADRAATLTLDHQVPVLTRGWGIWAVAGYVDVGAASFAGEQKRLVTPGLALRLYLPRLSFPAIGVDVSYSFETDEPFLAVSAGLSM